MKSQTIRKNFRWVWIGIFALLVCKQMDYLISDLPRHLANGKWILSGKWREILFSNAYSYTAPDFPFINHHWLFGALIYPLERAFGFGGLSLAYVLLLTLTFDLVMRFCEKSVPLEVAWGVGGIGLALAACRVEIRPEGISTFAAVIALTGLLSRALRPWHAFALMMVWTNSHIYFFIGLSIFGFFAATALVLKPKELWKSPEVMIGLCALLGTLITPFGYKLLFLPFTIMDHYEYPLAENQPIHLLRDRGWFEVLSYPFFALQGLWVISVAANMWIQGRKFFSVQQIAAVITGAFVTLFAWKMVRNVAMFSFLSMILIAWFMGPLLSRIKAIYAKRMGYALQGIAAMYLVFAILPHAYDRFGLGLSPRSLDSVRFFKEHHLKGPIFNNYDIGGALIGELFPDERVYVDNRPEAFPGQFFTDRYIPLHTDPKIWEQEKSRYGFNVIWIAWNELTGWGKEFRLARLKDPEWAPVYADPVALIMVRRTKEHEELIKKYEIRN